jgi:hypothetical protein
MKVASHFHQQYYLGNDKCKDDVFKFINNNTLFFFKGGSMVFYLRTITVILIAYSSLSVFAQVDTPLKEGQKEFKTILDVEIEKDKWNIEPAIKTRGWFLAIEGVGTLGYCNLYHTWGGIEPGKNYSAQSNSPRFAQINSPLKL